MDLWIGLVAWSLPLAVSLVPALLRRLRLGSARRLLGPRAFEGTLCGPDAIVTVLPHGTESPVRAVSGAQTRPFRTAWIEVAPGGGRFELDASVQVIVGSVERTSHEGVVHTVEPGDPVLVGGHVEPRAETTE